MRPTPTSSAHQAQIIFRFLLLILLVCGLSILSSRIWGAKPEKIQLPEKFTVTEKMTIRQFAEVNALPLPLAMKMFGPDSAAAPDKEIGSSADETRLQARLTRNMALALEQASKNWLKIPLKFLLWFLFLATVFILDKTQRLSQRGRNWLLFWAVVVFGVIMGSDPSPMGTVKDAIHLYGSARTVFIPRMIALTVFLTLVIVVNKYICAWGCQIGTLQDLIFRLNRNKTQNAILGRQIKPHFILTNTVRIVTLALFLILSFIWGFDAIDAVDPFKLFNPVHLGLIGALFLALILIASLFTYRPWCHFFCPFGLVGWLVEQFSLVRIRVDHDSCIACNKCANVCPSTVMKEILKGEKGIKPDCFACSNCREICPTGAISFSARKKKHNPKHSD